MDDSGGGTVNCGEIQDLLSDRAADRLASVDAVRIDDHLASCGECRELFETVRGLWTTRPAVPDDLEARAAPSAAPSPSRPRWRLSPAWALAAAAVLALAVGLPVVAPSDPEPEAEVGALALAEEGVGEVWLDDDLMVAGAPAFSELSDEALRTLLEEFEL